LSDEGTSSGDSEPPPDDVPTVVDGEVVDEAREPARAHIVAGEVIETFSFRQSPYPTPEDLAKYEQIHQGFTDRILTLTEEETHHRIRREEKQDDATIALAKRGQLLAFVVVMALVLGGVAAILTGHSIVGFAGLVIAAATLAGAFIAPEIFSRESGSPAAPGTEIEQPKARSDEKDRS
jgi:uncharacterized membrane protein